ncbi:MAG TPA: FG-GAP-like repeat-containing protein [Pyrinomonadaceae bacterium]
MSWTTINQSTRSLIYAAAVISLAAIGLWIGVQNNSIEASTTNTSNNAVPAATFAGTGTGNIPDLPSGTTCQTAQGTPLNVTFNVTGIAGNVSNVAVSANMTHSWVGDITTTLIAPNGASHTIFARTGATTSGSSGDSDNLLGVYNFADANTTPPSGGWWQETTATSTHNMTAGNYRTVASGGAGATDPAPATTMNPAFTGVSNANGTWTLRFTDGCALDTGSVSAATLTVEGAAAVATDANVDFNGDGKTDWVVARGTTTPLAENLAPSEFAPRRNLDSSSETKSRLSSGKTGSTENAITPPIYWYTTLNGSGTTGVGQLGDAATDFITPEDFDGDGKDDLVVWTEAAATQANFKILQSTTNTVRVELFGQTGDDPAVVGDYDGDNKADPAVYRCPGIGTGDGQCFFFYRGSNANPSGNVTYVPWGFGEDGDFFPLVGDFDGDGKNDFCVQRANPASPTNGQFVLLKSNGLGIEYINWGLSSDFLIPGDYDGDGKADFCVRRTVSGARQHWILYRTGATSFTNWGITGDSSVPGDYDGDGKTDLAVWRGSSTTGQSRFWVLNSSNSSVTQFTWGQCPTVSTCDFAVAGWAVH